MAKGGGGTSTQYVESSTSNLPKYAEPYYTSMMGQAQALTAQPYQRYTDPSGNPIERIAGFTPQQQRVQQDVLSQQTPGQFGMGSQLAAAAGLGSLMGGQYDPMMYRSRSFTQPGAAGGYMSPFIQQALEPQMREAVYSAKRGQLAQDLGAARQGTYGGSRQLLAGLERERNLGQQLGDIQSRGLQAAYEQAMQQFNTEQQARLEAQRATEASRQFGANLGLQGLAQAGQMGQTLGNLGQMQSQTDLARFSQQQATAAQEQALQQQYLDQQYQDFLRQQEHPFSQLQKYSSLLSSTPVSADTTRTMATPSPSIASQIMGTGLGALGMYKTLAG